MGDAVPRSCPLVLSSRTAACPPPAHLSLPTHQLQTCCVAPTYLHLVSGDNLKIPNPAGLTNAGFASDTLSASAIQPM